MGRRGVIVLPAARLPSRLEWWQRRYVAGVICVEEFESIAGALIFSGRDGDVDIAELAPSLPSPFEHPRMERELR